MARSTTLGFPRIGPHRELKRATEGHWAGRVGDDELDAVARAIRADGWRRQADAGIDLLPSNDFSLYDHVLDTAWALGAVERDAGYFALGWNFADARSNTESWYHSPIWIDMEHFLFFPYDFSGGVTCERVKWHLTPGMEGYLLLFS